MNSRLRSLVLVLMALVAVLAVTAGVLWLTDRGAGKVAVQGRPMSDAQAVDQVLVAAKQIVSVAHLHGVTGGYSFVSCQNETDPPYQVTIYMNFRLPQDNSVRYLRDVGASLAANGWSPSASTDEHFGQKLTRDGVTTIFYQSDDTDFATMRLYGECRNTADHRTDNPAWTEVTGQLG